MKTNTLLTIALAVAVSVILGLTFVSSSQKNVSSSNSQISEVTASNYIIFSPKAFSEAQKSGRTILFFWAPWCGTCSALDDEIKQRSSELPKDLTILRTNYDTQSDLKAKYNIITQHTLVQIDKDGNEIKKWIGGGVDLLKQQIR